VASSPLTLIKIPSARSRRNAVAPETVCPRRFSVRTWTPWNKTSSQSAGSKETAPDDPGAMGDHRRDARPGSLGIESSEATRREGEPRVLLAEAISRRASGRQHGNKTPAGEGNDRSADAVRKDDLIPRSGTMEIKLPKNSL
jgi:hypothetical protein